jgi:Putative addiction module component
MSIVDIQKMSTDERLRAMEALWDALSNESQELQSPEWHGRILAERKRRIQEGESKFVSIDEARNRLLG